MVTNGAGNLEVHFPSFRHGLEAIYWLLCKFSNLKGFSEANFSLFTAFTKCQNPFPFQMGGSWDWGFDVLYLNSKYNGMGFSLLLCSLLKAIGRGFWNGNGFYFLLLYSEVNGKGF